MSTHTSATALKLKAPIQRRSSAFDVGEDKVESEKELGNLKLES